MMGMHHAPINDNAWKGMCRETHIWVPGASACIVQLGWPPRLGFQCGRGCSVFQQCLQSSASKFKTHLEKLSNATLILFHVLHIKALMEIARIGAHHGGSQSDIQTKVPHQMSEINCPHAAVAQSDTSSSVEAAAWQAYCTGVISRHSKNQH